MKQSDGARCERMAGGKKTVGEHAVTSHRAVSTPAAASHLLTVAMECEAGATIASTASIERCWPYEGDVGSETAQKSCGGY
jgi:hypothetical protein